MNSDEGKKLKTKLNLLKKDLLDEKIHLSFEVQLGEYNSKLKGFLIPIRDKPFNDPVKHFTKYIYSLGGYWIPGAPLYI